MSKRLRNIVHCSLFIVSLFIISLFIQGVAPALSQDPTIPTRTPTPDPNAPPTATRDDGGEPPPPAPTDTPVAGATATTIQPGASATPTSTTAAGITLDAAASGTPAELTGEIGLPGCNDTPIVQAIKETLNIYAGPGGDYPIIGTMIINEIRLMIGRAEFADWWYIQFDPTTTAWVDDEDVNEYGNTGSVPLVIPPPINGNTPTPGPQWIPTPLPACTTTPTATPTETPTSTPTVTPVVDVQATGDGSNDAEGGTASTASGNPELVTAPPSATPYILPAVGAGLLGLGLVVGLLARRSGRAMPDTATNASETPADDDSG